MPVKIVKINSDTLPAIADAIRAKTGSTGSILPSQMAGKIANIPTGGELPVLSTPAKVGHVVAGKEYIDALGNKQTGTLVICDTVNNVETVGEAGIGVHAKIESTVDKSSDILTLQDQNFKSENIKRGISIFGVAGSVNEIRTETGTITPAEDTTSIIVPCSNGAKAFVLIPNSAVISAVEGQTAKRYVTTAVANFAGSIDGAPNTAMQVWNLSSYANAGRVSKNTDGVELSSIYYFYPGTYRWTAYYWEENQ